MMRGLAVNQGSKVLVKGVFHEVKVISTLTELLHDIRDVFECVIRDD